MMELVTGTFARRGERSAFGQSHPLNLLWQAFAGEAGLGPDDLRNLVAHQLDLLGVGDAVHGEHDGHVGGPAGGLARLGRAGFPAAICVPVRGSRCRRT